MRGRVRAYPDWGTPAEMRSWWLTWGPAAVGLVTSLSVPSKSERRAAREVVSAYHEARLAELVLRAGDAVDRFRAGELDASQTDQVIFQYSRAAKELWKFCNLPDVEFTAGLIRDRAPADWWERGAPRRR